MKYLLLVIALFTAFTMTTTARAQGAPAPLPFVSPAFGSHMVLQRDRENPIWGWTAPGATVTVHFAGRTTKATAGADGKWTARLRRVSAGGPYTIEIAGPHDNASLTDVLAGDVWFCSGQSNMEFGVGQLTDAHDVAAAANDPQLRLYLQPRAWGLTPHAIPGGAWRPCTPQTIVDPGGGGFSAVGYFFGRELRKEVGVPIGLIEASWGGTPAEAWTSPDAVAKLPEFADAARRIDALSTIDDVITAAWVKWAEKHDTPAYSDAAYDDSSWKTIDVPLQYWGSPFWDRAGVVWYRRTFDLPAVPASGVVLNLGIVRHFDMVWINGVQVGAGSSDERVRTYSVPSSVLKAGTNTIAIRLLNRNQWSGGFESSAESFGLHMPDQSVVSLAGKWRYLETVNIGRLAYDQMPPATAYDTIANTPGVLYNGMVAPLAGVGMSGAIWYQGEANAGQGYEYRNVLANMIDDWRHRWGQGDFPFYIVQLANYGNGQPYSPDPTPSYWAELRESQQVVADTIPHSGLAVTIDIGDSRDIHPKNKLDVGRRLALVALREHYHRNVLASGPTFKGMKIEGGVVQVAFDHADGGLAPATGSVKGFALAGDDQKFYWADAHVEGRTVVLSSAKVPHPVAVRYAWADDPKCNLKNGVGLPAAPFRTDSWRGVTQRQ